MSGDLTELDAEFDRMRSETIKNLYEAGRIVFYVDRGLATKWAGNGLPISGIAAILGFGFPVFLFAGIAVAIFYSIWIGIALVVFALASYKLARLRLVKEVRELALKDDRWFDILRKNRVIWFDKVSD